MKKHFLIAFAGCLVAGCSSNKRYNAHLNDLISEKDLKSDVDFIHKKLEQLHPNLYWYISKNELDHKFDSVKQTITRPMTSFDFHHKISPVISSVRQGHMYVYPPMKLYNKREVDSIKKVGTNPLSQFEYENINGKIYVVKNKSQDKTVKVGTEVISVNDISPSNLFGEYNHYFTSDGYNTTFKKNFSGTRFATFYGYELGVRDSVKFNFKFNDSIKTVVIKRTPDTTAVKKALGQKLTKEEKSKLKAQRKALRNKQDIQGFDDIAKVYNRNLRFIEADSSIAIMKINSFTKGSYDDFYEDSFRKIKTYKSKTLIIDLRNNGGGRLPEIKNLYTYLADSTAAIIGKSEVVSKTSLLRSNFLKGGSASMKIFKILVAPLFYSFNFFKVHRTDDGKYFYATDSKPIKLKPDAFKGKIYVLINGGSFSASCILSSNLKGSKRAYFIGEETGGTFNGTVAGIMPEVVLPKSKIHVRVGLVFIAPHYKTDKEGRGIFPDKEIIPTLQDRIDGRDSELEWILDDLKEKTSVAAQTAQN